MAVITWLFSGLFLLAVTIQGHVAEDVGACAECGTCSQRCLATQGAPTCSCDTGYLLQTDGRTCNKTDDVEPFLVFGNIYNVRRLGLDGSNYDTISRDHGFTHLLDVDVANEKIYFLDSKSSRFFRMSLTGQGASDLAIPPYIAAGVNGIAFEWITKKLYLTSRLLEGIYVSEANGTSIHTLVPDGSRYPVGIAVSPRTGYLFWTNLFVHPFISRVGLDGSMQEVIISSGLFWPLGLVIDHASDRIWWCDAHLDRIEMANLDGSGRQVVLTEVPHPFSITLFEDSIYWSENNLVQIETAPKCNASTGRQVLKRLSNVPYGIHVVHPLRQPRHSNNPCVLNGHCSHLCLIAPPGDTYACACPDSLTLTSDNHTCTTQCLPGQFMCNWDDHKCISDFQRCDGIKDCYGGEDEAGCPHRYCPEGYLQCGVRRCLHPHHLCSGHTACPGGEDENATICAARQCQASEFRCGSGQCIKKQWECDGFRQCNDGLDEANCGSDAACTEHEYRCNNNKCISKLWFCDLDNDCGDYSDEPRDTCWLNHTCAEGWTKCANSYRCIPTFALCDGRNNCGDNSDELSTSCPDCPIGDFKCANTRCVPARWVCNTYNDCGDNSDEMDCVTIGRNCSDAEFRCPDGLCISYSLRCDFHADCIDSSDEAQCTSTEYHCQDDTDFQCNNNVCIPGWMACNSYPNCPHGEDEVNCPPLYPNSNQTHCPPEEFQCDNNACIPRAWLCDSNNDCRDNSDEQNHCVPISCPADSFTCITTHQCLDMSRTCDGVDDCGDWSDENRELCGYNKTSCPDDAFRCHSGQCLPWRSVCDGDVDCRGPDPNDELGCDYGRCDGTCEQLCRKARIGHVCLCTKGYRNSPDRPTDCLDVDECATLHFNNCPQICNNHHGGFVCQCDHGFVKVDLPTINMTSCEPVDKDFPILMGRGGEIVAMYEHQSGVTREVGVVERQDIITDMDVDAIRNLVYWVSGGRELKRAVVSASSEQLSSPQHLAVTTHAMGMAVDWLQGNIYWTESVNMTGKVKVSREDGHLVKTIYSSEAGNVQPGAIALAPAKGYLVYLSRVDDRTIIYRHHMDGRGQRRLFRLSVEQYPVGLAVDAHMNDRLFWTDLKQGFIRSANIDGTDNHIQISGVQEPYSLDVFGGDIYWTSRTNQKLNVQNKFGSGPTRVLARDQYDINFVKVLSQSEHFYIENPCDTKGCNGLCLLRPVYANESSSVRLEQNPTLKARCACPDGSSFSAGNHTQCVLDDIPPRPLPDLCSCNGHGSCKISDNSQPTCVCVTGYTGERCADTKNRTSVALAVVIPVLVVTILVVVVLVVMYRTGRLGRLWRGHIRPSQPADNYPTSVEFVTTEENLQFSNPLYDTFCNGSTDPANDDSAQHSDVNGDTPDQLHGVDDAVAPPVGTGETRDISCDGETNSEPK